MLFMQGEDADLAPKSTDLVEKAELLEEAATTSARSWLSLLVQKGFQAM